MHAVKTRRPSWDRLFETASAQEGHFTTRQAAKAGYSPQLLMKYLRSRKVSRVRRGVYRLVHFPPGEHEDLVALWLWSERAGVFSHETALGLHGLSDVLSTRTHLTLPAAWRSRRFRVPPRVVIHHADVDKQERSWAGAVPLTSPRRTLLDCAASHLSPETIEQATEQALSRGLINRRDSAEVEKLRRSSGRNAG